MTLAVVLWWFHLLSWCFFLYWYIGHIDSYLTANSFHEEVRVKMKLLCWILQYLQNNMMQLPLKLCLW